MYEDFSFLYLHGLKELSKTLSGDERIFMGTRPWGFHAGNILTMVIYPYLLCEEVARRGLEPRFKVFVSLNDWEPHRLLYRDKGEHPYNFFPEGTSFQYTNDPKGCCSSIVEHYEDPITRAFDPLKDAHKLLEVNFRRVSDLKNEQVFQDILRRCFEEKDAIGKQVESVTGEKISYDTLQWTGVICPSCNSANGETAYDGSIRFTCHGCGETYKGKLSDFDFWWYHLPMLIPRILYFRPDIIVRGGDHYDYKGLAMLYSLLEYFGHRDIRLKTLVSPKLLALDGNKMSKSIGNQAEVNFQKLLSFAREFEGDVISLQELQ
ncbi:MAG: hypothetical protein COS47_01315 [Candidatus Nealsonbacteria bacterium CG03_land_8_20_14_0_80_36_12]|uniref:Methionyl/Leucyl tRNA synthetase domain-containing protein n=1 Tax=Candidatus Nealsonbacteria bacterium CG03_land_8_20_14_0_80_36_12 TaxID=1974701 RepID=A0A2M7BYC2_9BACT|nr:MAG: hypothetical protein COS47_01315 [Candidatus Nealsonbacteria bacterium CG03_land_8_20_14_0_80_36_12]